MRLIELHEKQAKLRKWNARYLAGAEPGYASITAANLAVTERQIEQRLAEGSIGWNPPLRYGVPDAVRRYELLCRCSGPHCAHNAKLAREQAERAHEVRA